MRALMLALVLFAAPATRAAERGLWAEVGGGMQWVTDPSYDLVSDSDLAGAFVFAAGWSPGWVDGRLSLRLGYAASGATSELFGTWKSNLSHASLDAGVRYDFARSGRGSAFVRGGALVDLASLEISASGGPAVQDTAFGAGLLLALGGEWALTAPARVRLALASEVGFGLRVLPVRFDALSPAPGEPAPIAFVPVNAGDIDLSGPFWRIALVVRL